MRKRFLVKPALQLKHLAWTLGVVGLAFTACYVLFERQVTLALYDGAMDQAAWVIVRGQLRIGFSIALIVILIGVGLENYFFFHTVAGPIFALEKGIRRLAAGDFENITQTRKNDELADVIEAFEEMKKQISSRIESHERTAQLLTQELDRLLSSATHDDVATFKKRLQQIRNNAENKAA